MPNVLMVTSEASPFHKVGGLADVLGSLPAALQKRGADVAVVLPFYRGSSADGAQPLWRARPVSLGRTSYPIDVSLVVRNCVPHYLVACPALFDRAEVHSDPATGEDFPDNHIHFGVLCQAALALARYLIRVEILHCHDWQSALVPVYHRVMFAKDPILKMVKTLFTIHNIGYQGLFEPTVLPELGLDQSIANLNGLEFYGRVNLLKGGISYSDAISTVSASYAADIQLPEFGFGLDGVLRERADRLVGILNGVNYDEWNPEKDPFIAERYGPDALSGKRSCKADLQRTFGLAEEPDVAVIGIVSRLVSQKGFDLLEGTSDRLLSMGVQLVVLGSGDQRYESFFQSLATQCPSKIGVRIGFDELLAHKIEAGADMFLMPSLYEPCGLNQFYSLKYGTIPIVRATGGLKDSVQEFDAGTGCGNGFAFQSYDSMALLEALGRALSTFRDKRLWSHLMRNAMTTDYSWDWSAREYLTLYERLLGK